ncbi:uncharacterized protein [Dermacentor albipictus]|uniref:uncharacterized protein isoform X2 n=1 Tax=Dermacentor albipictus TaxID=60249 RepID=UPI0031FD930C
METPGFTGLAEEPFAEMNHGQTTSYPSTYTAAELSEQYHESFSDDSMNQLLVGRAEEGFFAAEHDYMTPSRTTSWVGSYTKSDQNLFSTWKWLAMFLTCCVIGFATTLLFFTFIDTKDKETTTWLELESSTLVAPQAETKYPRVLTTSTLNVTDSAAAESLTSPRGILTTSTLNVPGSATADSLTSELSILTTFTLNVTDSAPADSLTSERVDIFHFEKSRRNNVDEGSHSY